MKNIKFKSSKTKVLLKIILLAALSIFIFLLYLSGALSFFRRSIVFSSCVASNKKSCTSPINLSRKTNVLNQILEKDNNDSTVLFQNVVYAKLVNRNLWVWSIDSILEKYYLTGNTTYGVAVSASQDDLAGGKFKELLRGGKLKVYNDLPYLSLDSPDILVLTENNPGTLDREEFEGIVETGNLVKIVYSGNNREIIGIVLLDFKKI